MQPAGLGPSQGGRALGFIEEPLGTSLEPMAAGLEGVEQTVLAMTRLAAQGSASAELRTAAENAVRHIAARDWAAEASAVESWVRGRLRYTRDGLKIETLKTVPRMLTEIRTRGRFAGDCDDAAVLSAALLLSIGHAPAFLVLGRGQVPHHVAVLDRTSGKVVDPTGEPRGPYRFRRTYDVVSPV